MTASEVFTQNDGSVTRAYYAQLEERGPIGKIATCLFRAQKRSTAAKRYRGGRYKRAAYDVKNWSLQELCYALQEHGASRGITFGWKEDPKTEGYPWVLYVDLPQGQVSFHSATRGLGPDYPNEWDGQRGASEERILAFCDNVLGAKPVAVEQLFPRGIATSVIEYAKAVQDAAEVATGVQPSLFPDVRKEQDK